MIHKTDIKRFARKVFKGQKRPKNPELMHPSREWIIGLLVAFVMFFGTAAWSAQTYLEYRDVSIGDNQQEQETVVVYRESLVNAALEIFSERESTLNSLLASTPPVVLEPTLEVEDTATSTVSEVVEDIDDVNTDSENATETATTTIDSE